MNIQETVDLLKDGAVIVYPTDTVYGIGCVYDNEDAIKRVFELKQRDRNKPLPLLVSDQSQLSLITSEISAKAKLLMDAYWPGALTLLVNKKDTVSNLITCDNPTVAVRCPNNDELREIIRKVGKPIIGTSANLSGEPSITSFQEAFNVFKGKVDLIIEGECRENISSTIVDITKNPPIILREGPITSSDINKLFINERHKMKVAIGSDHRGSALKSKLIEHLKNTGHEVVDCGTESDQPVDYPIIAQKACVLVQNKDVDRAILICGTGLGMSIAANKFDGIRAALCNSNFMAERSRLHNNANVLCLGAEYEIDQEAIVDIFMTQEYEGGRHQKRLDLIASFE